MCFIEYFLSASHAQGTCAYLTLSGTTLTKTSSLAIGGTADTYQINVVGLTASTAAVCHSDTDQGYELKCNVLTLSGSSFSAGSDLVVGPASVHHPSMASTSTTGAALCYFHDGSHGSLRCRILPVSGTGLCSGASNPTVDLCPDFVEIGSWASARLPSVGPGLAVSAPSTGVVCYQYEEEDCPQDAAVTGAVCTYDFFGKCQALTVTDGGSEFVLSGAATFVTSAVGGDPIAVGLSSAERGLACYNDVANQRGVCSELSLGGTEGSGLALEGSPSVFNANQAVSIAITPLGAAHALVSFGDGRFGITSMHGPGTVSLYALEVAGSSGGGGGGSGEAQGVARLTIESGGLVEIRSGGVLNVGATV